MPSRARRLDVYVARHCRGCTQARRLAGEVARKFPGVVVRVIDLDEDRERAGTRGAAGTARAAEPLPAQLVAVPAYLYNGVVISLGNPRPEELFARIAGIGLRESS